jgi:hypothetical protein
VTTREVYAIRREFLLPLGILLLQSLALFVICLVKGEPTAKIVILGGIILPIAGLFVESARRRAVVEETGVTVYKVLRQKTIHFSDLTAVETVQVRKRAFLTLSTEEDFLILSNAYAGFPALVHGLLKRVPAATVSPETRQLAQNPPRKSSDIVSCWMGVALLALILYSQLGGTF